MVVPRLAQAYQSLQTTGSIGSLGGTQALIPTSNPPLAPSGPISAGSFGGGQTTAPTLFRDVENQTTIKVGSPRWREIQMQRLNQLHGFDETPTNLRVQDASPSYFIAKNLIESQSFGQDGNFTKNGQTVFGGGFADEVTAGEKTFADIAQADLEAKKKKGGPLTDFTRILQLAAYSIPFANLAAGGLTAALGTLGGSAATGLSQVPGLLLEAGQGFGGSFANTFGQTFQPSAGAGAGASLPAGSSIGGIPISQLGATGISAGEGLAGAAAGGVGGLGFAGGDFSSLTPQANAALTQAGITPEILSTASQTLEAGGGLSLEKLAPLVGASGALSLTAEEFANLSAGAAAAGKTSVGIFDLISAAGSLASGVGGIVGGIQSLTGSAPTVGGSAGAQPVASSLTSPSFGVQFGATPSLTRTGGEDPAAIEQANRARLGDIGAGFAGLQSQIPGFQQQFAGQPFGDVRAGTERLRQQVDATRSELGGQFNKVREARLQELGNARDRTVGNLRDTLRQRRVFGSGFANADIERAELGFAQEGQRVISEAAIQEAAIRGDFDRIAGSLLELDQRTLLQETQNIAFQAGLNEQQAGLLGQQMATIQAEQASLQQTLAREFNELTIPGNLANGVAAIVANVGANNASLAITNAVNQGKAIAGFGEAANLLGSGLSSLNTAFGG